MSWSEQTADALATFYCNEPFAQTALETAHNADDNTVRLHNLIEAKKRLMKMLAPIEAAQLDIMRQQTPSYNIQRITSAPRDGRMILVWPYKTASHRLPQAWYCAEWRQRRNTKGPNIPGAPIRNLGWLLVDRPGQNILADKDVMCWIPGWVAFRDAPIPQIDGGPTEGEFDSVGNTRAAA